MGRIKDTQGHYYEVALTTADGHCFTGKGKTEGAARTAAKKRAKDKGFKSQAEINAMTEDVRSLVGPNPRTFTGNRSTPE